MITNYCKLYIYIVSSDVHIQVLPDKQDNPQTPTINCLRVATSSSLSSKDFRCKVFWCSTQCLHQTLLTNNFGQTKVCNLMYKCRKSKLQYIIKYIYSSNCCITTSQFANFNLILSYSDLSQSVWRRNLYVNSD